jgi:hypothetical protein
MPPMLVHGRQRACNVLSDDVEIHRSKQYFEIKSLHNIHSEPSLEFK